MSYEVYIEVRHHPRHNEDWEQKESSAFRFSDGPTPHEHVLNGLRGMADDLERKWEIEAAEKAAEQARVDARAAWEERQRRPASSSVQVPQDQPNQEDE